MGTLGIRAWRARAAAVRTAAGVRRRQRAGGSRRVHALVAGVERAVRHRARRSAARARRRALSSGATAPAHADHARSRLSRRSQVPSRAQRRRGRADGADPGRLHPAPETTGPGGPACGSAAWAEHADVEESLPLEGRKLHVHVDWDGRVIVLSNGDVVLPDRVLTEGSIIIDAGRIATDRTAAALISSGRRRSTRRDCYVVPGFIDVHVHGVEGHDTLDGGDAVAQIAARLPRYGVTAFCPTTVACPPDELRAFLQQVRDARATPCVRRRRVCCPRISRATSSTRSFGARSRRRVCASAGAAAAGWRRTRHATSSTRSRRRGPTSAS